MEKIAAMAPASSTDGAIQIKMQGRDAIVKSGAWIVKIKRWITFVISSGNMDDIIRIKKSLENSDILIDVVIETLKQEWKFKKVDLLVCY